MSDSGVVRSRWHLHKRWIDDGNFFLVMACGERRRVFTASPTEIVELDVGQTEAGGYSVVGRGRPATIATLGEMLEAGDDA